MTLHFVQNDIVYVSHGENSSRYILKKVNYFGYIVKSFMRTTANLAKPTIDGKTSSIPDTSWIPKIKSLKEYFQYRRRIERIAKFYRKTTLKLQDDQGLPHVRREILNSAR